MRYIPSIFNKLSEAATGGFIGDRKTNGRVTVEPLWQLKATPPSYGNSIRGPYRYFQDVADSGVQWEVPNIKNISWDRQESQDLASCTITLYNMWHEGNLEEQELEGQLGKPGYFWPKRGLEVNRWNQLGGKGSMRKDGFWDPNFSWQNVLVQYALIRTYEGFVNPNALSSPSIQDDLDDEYLVQTGTWLVDFVSAGSNGEMVLNCKDMGKLLLDQSCFPPIIPDGLYPLEYYPAGKSAFDSVFGAKPKTGVSPGSQGEVKSEYVASSADDFNEGFDVDIYGHKGSYAVDGNWLTSSWSEAHPLPAATVYWDFDILDPISKLSIKTWAGGYECYVSIMRDDEWLAGETIPGLSEPYLVKINIPFAIPDNNEPVINIELPDSFKNLGETGYAQRVKISFRNLYYSGLADGFNFYRGGIRDLIFYREGAKVDPYTPDFATIPWTFSMCAHPTRGYWVIDDGGNVYGFGDAADYDSTAFGAVPLAARSGHDDNQSIAMCAHPDGKGYWVLDRMGHVYPYGSAEFYGEFEVAWPGTDKWGEDGLAAWDITPTHTGNGYWVCYGDGHIRGFGDAAPNDVILPWSDVAVFMNSVVNSRYLYQHQANGITSHPTKMGFWVTTGSGEVYAFGDAVHYGQLDQRVYNRGMADTFMLAKTEYTKSIEATKSGNGYWIAFGSGHIAAFGDAVGQGPSYIYPQNNTGIDIPIDETNIIDWSFFRAIVWDMARDPDGTGFWVLVADGNVGSYSAEFWGSPGYQGLTGFRWHEGNFDGDYSSVLSELLKWCGFTLYNPTIGGSDAPEVFGAIESTGIKTDTFLSAEKFDKRPIIDVIKELCEVVGYRFLIQEDGSIRISSPNIWRSGNFDVDGIRIYVDSDGNRVDPDDPDAIEFIPMIDEEIDMFDYNTTLSSESMRSEIIIGNELPNPSDPRVTSFIRHTPRSGSELVAPGIPMLRGISRVGIWTSQMFQNLEEMKLMAELISLNAWFAERTGTVNCIANPCLSLGDQVKLAERNTSEYNIHYISGISSNHDLDTGVWTYTLTTHWLGDADNWVITANESAAPVDGYHYIEISERVDRWQQDTNRGLVKGSQAYGEPGNANLIEFYGEFDKSSTPLYTQTIPSPSTTKLYSLPNWDDGFTTSFPPPPQGGMTYVNRLYDESDISQLDIEMEVFNVAPADSMLYLQLYDGDCGDAGQYFGWQTQSLLLWSQFGTNDLDNIEAGPGATTVSDEELGAPFIGLRKVLPTDYLDPGVYKIRVERNEFDNSAWGDAAYAFGGDWFSMYAKIPSGEEFLLGRMRFPREASGVPAAFHDNGGEWMEAYENNNDITLYPVDYLHVATRAKANGQDAISATSTVSLMPNLDIWAEEPKSSWVHHEIGGDIVRHHDTGTLWDSGTTNQSDNIVNKIVWQYIPYATSYKVYRGETADDMDLIATTTDFVFFDAEWNDDNRINPALDYVYGVSAVTEDGESEIGIYDPENSRRDDQWLFEGTLKLNKSYDNLYVKVEALTAPLGNVVFFELYQNGTLVWNQEIENVNQPILLPNVTGTTYTFNVSGYPTKTGNGYLKLNIADPTKSISTTDTLLVTR